MKSYTGFRGEFHNSSDTSLEIYGLSFLKRSAILDILLNNVIGFVVQKQNNLSYDFRTTGIWFVKFTSEPVTDNNMHTSPTEGLKKYNSKMIMPFKETRYSHNLKSRTISWQLIS